MYAQVSVFSIQAFKLLPASQSPASLQKEYYLLNPYGAYEERGSGSSLVIFA